MVIIDLKDELQTQVEVKPSGSICIKQGNNLTMLSLKELDAIVESCKTLRRIIQATDKMDPPPRPGGGCSTIPG